MKISPVLSYKPVYTNNSKKIDKISKNNNFEIENNDVNSLMGRVQVNFGSAKINENNLLEFVYPPSGDNGFEKIIYDKKTGNLKRQFFDPNGIALLMEESYDSRTETVCITEYYGDLTKETVETKKQRIVTNYSNNVIIHRETIDKKTGTTFIETAEPQRGRVVCKEYNGKSIKCYVRDIDTGKYLKDGDKVKETIFDKVNLTRSVVNIARNITEEIRRFDSNGALLSIDVYHPKTGVLIYHEEQNQTTKNIERKTYYSNGRDVKSFTIKPVDESFEEVMNYDRKGFLVSHFKKVLENKFLKEFWTYESDKTTKANYVPNFKYPISKEVYVDGNLSILVEYANGTDSVKTKTFYYEDGSLEIFYYNVSDGALLRSEKLTKEQVKEREIENMLNEVMTAIGRVNSYYMELDIDPEKLDKFAKMIGFQSFEMLCRMDNKEYKKLMKKFHPDLNRDKKYASKISAILNGINDLREYANGSRL